MSSVADTSSAREDRELRWLVRRFYLSMLAIAGIDFCFAVIYEVPFARFLPTFALLVGAILVGAHYIFLPIRRYLDDPGGMPYPARRVGSLASTCTAYVAAVIGTLAAVKFVAVPALLDFDLDDLLTRNEQLWLPVLHTLYYTALTYFVMMDYEAELRARLFLRHGRLTPARRGRFLYRLLIAFGVTSLLPVSLITLHALERDLPVERYVLTQDFAATTLALAVSLLFVTRSLLRPIRALEEAMVKVRRNDLTASVPILSADETGRLAAGFNAMVKGLRERVLIRETFGKYLPEHVAEAILASAGRLEPRSATATILYADIESFTRIAERSSPDTVVAMLNEYFAAILEAVEAHNGVVTQLQGDAVLVAFNLPVPDPDHARSALRAGLAILDICNARRFGGERLRTRVGIATGRVTAGNVGSESRYTYTVHGDAVNLAARLEQLNKELGTHLLMDQETAERIGSDTAVDYVGETEVRGRASTVRLYTAASSATASNEARPPVPVLHLRPH
ncbi:MAG: adenylate/guanylate cyclase domain-containing protein [Gammaproteobacteria bacterium]|nr:adenylate/guanylate cyclase domain-containing protein [Gammaproteobacteria bacterium]